MKLHFARVKCNKATTTIPQIRIKNYFSFDVIFP